MSTRAFAAVALCTGFALVSPARAQSVPVTVATVAQQNLPIYAIGIGSVAANQMADVRAQVSGVIQKIAFTEGQEVKQGDLLAQIDPRPYQAALDQAIAKRQADAAALTDAKRNQARDAFLAKTHDIAQQVADTQDTTVSQDAATVAGDDAAIASARLNLEFTRITAPIGGRAGLRQIDLGNLVSADQTTPVTTIAEIHPISVLFTLPQDRMTVVAGLLAQQQPADVIAMSADNKTELGRGTLLTADNTIDPTTGTIKLKAMFPNKNNHLWPGEFVNVKLLTGVRKGAITVPSVAVQRSPSGPFVFLVVNGKAKVQPVALGPDDGTTAVVTGGVSPGQTVVVDGMSRLADGTPVEATPESTT